MKVPPLYSERELEIIWRWFGEILDVLFRVDEAEFISVKSITYSYKRYQGLRFVNVHLCENTAYNTNEFSANVIISGCIIDLNPWNNYSDPNS